MKKWIMTMRLWQDVDFEVEANTYNDAVAQAYELAEDFPQDSLEDIQCALYDYEELPEEEFESD